MPSPRPGDTDLHRHSHSVPGGLQLEVKKNWQEQSQQLRKWGLHVLLPEFQERQRLLERHLDCMLRIDRIAGEAIANRLGDVEVDLLLCFRARGGKLITRACAQAVGLTLQADAESVPTIANVRTRGACLSAESFSPQGVYS